MEDSHQIYPPVPVEFIVSPCAFQISKLQWRHRYSPRVERPVNFTRPVAFRANQRWHLRHREARAIAPPMMTTPPTMIAIQIGVVIPIKNSLRQAAVIAISEISPRLVSVRS